MATIQNFFFLEGAYLLLGLFTLLITLFVTTRPFMKKTSVKKGLFWVSLVIAVMIGGHYTVTNNRMSEVRTAFENGETIICENRATRKVAPTVIINKAQEWILEDDNNFVSPNYSRAFFSARCIIK